MCRQNLSILCERRIRWTGHVARMGEENNACRLLVGKPERKGTSRKAKTQEGG
jgi:hypothetical protein